MSNIVNLNKARKAKNKADKQKKASENRIIFGISTKIRNVEIKKADLESKKLDQRLLSPLDGNKKDEC
ncbi:DUF4169 family protein [Asticcacaulis sp. ZE23SCel15]|uniref:DUF4169 family protein n=1 Tax=Asticcacaulis sp. ZE23SCel15 TaxID=3059027 RepID=UPI00265F99C4|nr:DUF4169 family protein [Asticcacaulis sp. ZE23SCel15]WKL57570.1 DUF4169 family protein [Asticcacaulis sp. ZE23SCel15]